MPVALALWTGTHAHTVLKLPRAIAEAKGGRLSVPFHLTRSILRPLEIRILIIGDAVVIVIVSEITDSVAILIDKKDLILLSGCQNESAA